MKDKHKFTWLDLNFLQPGVTSYMPISRATSTIFHQIFPKKQQTKFFIFLVISLVNPMNIIYSQGTTVDSTVLYLDDPKLAYQATDYLEIFDGSNQAFTLEEISKKPTTEFMPFKEFENFEDDGVYWAKLWIQDISNIKNSKKWILDFDLNMSHVDFYTLQKSGNWQMQKTGFFVPFNEKSFTPDYYRNYVELILEPNEKKLCIFRVENVRKKQPPEFFVRARHDQLFYHNHDQIHFQNGLFIGFVALFLIYNLLLFSFIRDAPYFYYSFYLISVLLYFGYVTGAFGNFLIERVFSTHPEYYHTLKLTFYFINFSYLLFINSFLESHQFYQKLRKISIGILTLGAVIFCVDAYSLKALNFNFYYSDRLAIGYSFLTIIFIIIFLTQVIKKKDKKGYFIVIGFGCLVVGGLFYSLDLLGAANLSILFIKFGFILEISVFSYALAYKRKQNLKEKKSAIFELEKSILLQKQQEIETTRLKELGEFKTNFYTNITHEFRTPLTVILGITDELKTSANEKINRNLNLIQKNGNQLLSLVNQLLDFSKLESGHLSLNIEQSDIISFLKYLTESFHSFAAQKGVQIYFNSNLDSLELDFDKERIQQIFENLISNAIKFTPENGHIQVSCGTKNRHFIFQVKDSGIGIPKDEISLIFDSYYQVENSRNQNRYGTGVGLALVKELVKLMKGDISVKSELNHGTTFIVSLPISKEASLNGENPELAKVQTSTPLILENNENKSNGQNGTLPIILLIEDNSDVIQYLSLCLNGYYRLKIAKNGEEGVKKAFKTIPDLIISDVMMPHKDGFEVTQILKSDTRTSHIPIILLTAKADIHSKLEGLDKGADVYLPKPFQKEELLLRIRKLLEMRDNLRQYYLQMTGLQNGNLDEEPISEIANTWMDSEHEFVQKIVEFIQSNMDDSTLSVKELCKEMAMSQPVLYRKMTSLTGHSPNKILRLVRIHKALELLENTDLTITEITYKIGFSDPHYLSRVFKQEFGHPPTYFRKIQYL